MGLVAKKVVIQQAKNETGGVETVLTVTFYKSPEAVKVMTEARNKGLIESLRFRLGTAKYYLKHAFITKEFDPTDPTVPLVGFEISGRKLEIK